MRLDPHLAPRNSNFSALTPLDFLERAISCWPDHEAVIWRDLSLTWREFGDVVQRLVVHLSSRGIGDGDVVSVMCANRPEMLAAHYAVPAVGAVLNSLNTRLDAPAVTWILEHSESKHVLVSPECAEVARTAAAKAGTSVEIFAEDGVSGGLALLDAAAVDWISLTTRVKDEWQPIALNYTSGTTGGPKGVVLHHRGAYLNALGNVTTLGLTRRSRYLWTLPMFHCNGWCHTWAVTAAGGVHVCLDKVVPASVFNAIARNGITHLACAPVVLYMLLNDPARDMHQPAARVIVASGGAAPTVELIESMDALGFEFLHLYGLTECYGPTSLRELDVLEAEARVSERARLLARQGVRHTTANRIRVVDDHGGDVPQDGETAGEIVLVGNTLMAGYYKDPEATEAAFADAGFRTGDIAVVHPGGDIEIRDRAKDVIITGGENVSSLEIENVLHRHPSVLLAAVVVKPDPKWGETPMAFIELKAGHSPSVSELEAFCRQNLANFKVPRSWSFGELPKTATGKIQKYVLREWARSVSPNSPAR